MVRDEVAYIPLETREKKRALVGTYLLWFHHVLFSLTTPVILPSVMETYDMMGWYAILSGLSALLGCVAVPIGGKLGDIYGRRRVCLLCGYSVLGLMILCAFQTSGPIFIGIYSLVSFLNGVLGSYPITILSDLSTTYERPRLVGLYSAVNGVGFFVGMLLGGVIADYIGAFYGFVFFMPIGLTGVLLLTWNYPNKPADHHVPIDKIGLVLMVASVSCILAWCFFGGLLFPRGSALGIALLVGGVVLLGVLLRVERRISEPLLDLNMFRYKPFIVASVSFVLFPFFANLCSSLLILYGKTTLGLSATMSASLALPKNLMFSLIPPFVGAWLGRDYARFRPVFLSCGGAMAVGSLIAATWNGNTPVLFIYLTMVIFGVSSCSTNTFPLYVQVTLPQKDIGIASSMVMFFNAFGGALYNALYNIAYNGRYQEAMAQGGGEHLAKAINEVFSQMALWSALGGIIVVALAFFLVPGRKRETLGQ